MSVDIEYYNHRTQQEAIMAIKAADGPAQDAHDELVRAYLGRLIDAFGPERAKRVRRASTESSSTCSGR